MPGLMKGPGLSLTSGLAYYNALGLWSGGPGLIDPNSMDKAGLYFSLGRYWLNGVEYLSAATVPGWTFSRPGTNLLLQSQTFDNASWTKYASSVSANSIANPLNGTVDADTLVEAATTDFHFTSQTGTRTASAVYTLSAYVKANGRNAYLQLDDGSSNGANIAFNLANGTLGTVSGFGTGWSASGGIITALSDGWYRISVAVTTGTGTASRAIVGLTNSTTPGSVYIGNGTSGIYVWGAQLEPGSTVGGYQPTTGTAVTSGVNTTYAEGLVDDVVTNLLLWSQALGTSPWVSAGTAGTTVASDAMAAPDGTITADKIVATASSGTHTRSQAYATALNAPFTWEISVKAGEYPRAVIGMTDTATGDASALIDLATGAVVSSSAGGSWSGLSVVVAPQSGGWYRVSLTATKGAGSFVGAYAILDNGSGTTFAGDGVSGIYAWGGQLTQRSGVCNYIPTTTAPASGPSGVKVNGLIPFAPNVPRITDKGLLVEEARTNLLLRSREFGNASWVKSATTVTAAQVVAPDGTTTADFLKEDGTTAFHRLGQTITVTANTAYVASIYAKAGTRRYVWLQPNFSGFTNDGVFDLQTGAVSGTGASITALGNGWYRCSVSFTTGAATTSLDLRPGLSTSMAIASYSGDNTSGAYIWQADLQAGSFITSPIPTTTAAATRAADNPYITGLGSILGQFRTNLLPYSEDQTQASWGKTNVTAASAGAVGPNGIAATRITLTAGTNVKHLAISGFVYPSTGTVLTQSWFVKFESGVRYVQLPLDGTAFSGSRYANFDLQLGTVTQTSGASVTASISDEGDGWFRISATSTTSGTGTSGAGYLWVVSSGTAGFAPSFTATGTETLLATGAQLETGPIATAYIPTTTAAVTVGNPFTMVAWGEFPNSTGTQQLIEANRNPAVATDRIPIYRSSGLILAAEVLNNTVTFSPTASLPGARTIKSAVRVRASGFQPAFDGTLLANTAATAPSGLSRLDLGTYGTLGNAHLNGYLQRVIIYGDLSDEQLRLATV